MFLWVTVLGGSISWVFSSQGQRFKLETLHQRKHCYLQAASASSDKLMKRRFPNLFQGLWNICVSPHQKKKNTLLILLISSVHLDSSVIPQLAGETGELVCFFPLKDSLVSDKKIERCQEKFPTSAVSSEVASYASAVDNRLRRHRGCDFL